MLSKYSVCSPVLVAGQLELHDLRSGQWGYEWKRGGLLLGPSNHPPPCSSPLQNPGKQVWVGHLKRIEFPRVPRVIMWSRNSPNWHWTQSLSKKDFCRFQSLTFLEHSYSSTSQTAGRDGPHVTGGQRNHQNSPSKNDPDSTQTLHITSLLNGKEISCCDERGKIESDLLLGSVNWRISLLCWETRL